MFSLKINYILNCDLSILNIFQVLKINSFVNYLLLNKYGNVFQYEVKCFEIISFKDKLKVNIWNWFSNGWSVEIITCKDIFENK